MLLPFLPSYLCETEFSAVDVLKTFSVWKEIKNSDIYNDTTVWDDMGWKISSSIR